MSGGGKGGGQTTTASIPDWVKEPSVRNLARAEAAQKIGYMPYMGADVAAINPLQQQAMQSNYDAAAAFGMAPVGGNAMAGLPQAQDFGGGVMGYSSYPMFEASQQQFAAQQPNTQAAYDQLFFNDQGYAAAKPQTVNVGQNQNSKYGPYYEGAPTGLLNNNFYGGIA